MDDQELPVFMSHFLRDLQENREAWLQEIASEMETALREDVTGLIGRETAVRAFKIPELSSLHSAPAFSAPRKEGSSGVLPGIVGGILGTIFGGPLVGAGVAFLGRTLFGDDFEARKAEALNRYRSECGTFLGQCVTTAKDDVQSLLQGMADGWIPQFFTPFESEIARQQERVCNAKADLGKGENERAEIWQRIQQETGRLMALLNRSQAFLGELKASGNR